MLIISAVSIAVIDKDNDTRTEEELIQDGTPRGIKKIQDLGVFAITTVWSVVAYVWLYVVLSDGVVKPWEAWLTFGFFWLLLAMAYVADKVN